MKKFGFTLSEVLISLTVIGVVSALTIPHLLKNSRSATVGPKLTKAVNIFESANQKLLFESGIDNIGLLNAYPNTLTNYINMHSTDQYTITTYNGDNYTVNAAEGSDGKAARDGAWFITTDGMVYSINTGSNRVHIDVNGSTGPNRVGKDVFVFSLWNNGTLRPKGAHNWDGTNNNLWSINNRCTRNDVTDGTYCAGSIFENDFKVIYP